MSLVPLSDLARAAYCPRQLYYARRDDERAPPPEVSEVRALAFQYPQLRAASDNELQELPIALSPGNYRANLQQLRERDVWEDITEPLARDVQLTGKDCRGITHKLVGDSPIPVLVSPGDPPERGVWEPQRVRAVGLAKALAWERNESVERAIVEYPAHGIVRTVRLTVHNTAAYRRALTIVRTLDFVPSRLGDSAKCESCSYRTKCGVKTRSLKSLLGF